MQFSTLPSFAEASGVRNAVASAFEERHPWIRFFNEPDGGAGGDNSGAGSDSGDPDGGAGGADKDEPLGEGGKRALEAERAENKDLRARLKEFEDAKLTGDQKLQRDAEESKTRVGELEAANTNLELTNARLLVAIEEKVPADWVSRIQGATPDEMREDAKKIKASLRETADNDETPGAGQRGGSIVETSPGMGTLRAAYATSK